jgi:hypothetical protein
MNLEGRGYELLKTSRNFLAEVEQKSSNVIPLDIGVLRLIVFGANSYRHFGSRPVLILRIVDICGFFLCPTYHNRHPNCTKFCTSACYSHFPIFFRHIIMATLLEGGNSISRLQYPIAELINGESTTFTGVTCPISQKFSLFMV